MGGAGGLGGWGMSGYQGLDAGTYMYILELRLQLSYFTKVFLPILTYFWLVFGFFFLAFEKLERFFF